MIDFKYFAGFVDADGSISIHVQKRDDDRYGLYPKVQIGQLAFRNDNLKEVADLYNVNLITRKLDGLTLVELTGSKAEMFLNNIKKHLVIKDDVCEYILSLPKEVNRKELSAIKTIVKQLRKKNTPTKNFPSRKWMAGYIDGDGCLDCTIKPNGTLSTRLTIASAVDAQAGCRLIAKQFGGNFTIRGNALHYQISMSLSKTREIYDYCGKHLRIKKAQMELVHNYVGQNKHSKSNGATFETNKSFQRTLATTKSLGIRKDDAIVY